MPRAQRTKSAVHEALQRRARHGPGDSFSEELAGETRSVFLAGYSVLCFGLARTAIMSLRRWPVQPPHSRSGDRTVARQAFPHPAGLTTDRSVAHLPLLCDGWAACLPVGRRACFGRAGGTVKLATHGRGDAPGGARVQMEWMVTITKSSGKSVQTGAAGTSCGFG
jgi:hypothetical protein